MQGEAYLVTHLGKILYTDTDSMQGEGFMKTMTVSNIAPINHDQPFLARNSHKLFNKNKIGFVFILLVYFWYTLVPKFFLFSLTNPFFNNSKKRHSWREQFLMRKDEYFKFFFNNSKYC